MWLVKIFPNFAIQSAVPFPLLRPPEPEWVNLKTDPVRPSETLEQFLATHFETPIDRGLTYKQLQLWKLENFLCKWTFHCTYCMSYCGRQVALTVWSEVTKEQSVTPFYIEGMCIRLRYNAFCINFIFIIGRTDLINFRCLAILLAQQAVRYVKQSKQSGT